MAQAVAENGEVVGTGIFSISPWLEIQRQRLRPDLQNIFDFQKFEPSTSRMSSLPAASFMVHFDPYLPPTPSKKAERDPRLPEGYDKHFVVGITEDDFREAMNVLFGGQESPAYQAVERMASWEHSGRTPIGNYSFGRARQIVAAAVAQPKSRAGSSGACAILSLASVFSRGSKRSLGELAIPIAFVAMVAFLIYAAGYAFAHIWKAHVEATIAANAPNASEQRLIITAVVASIISITVSLLSALFSSFDRSRVLRAERAKKGNELMTESAFGLWKAAVASYRMLSKAETQSFKATDQKRVTAVFEDAEKTTLLFEQDILDLFHALWGECEVIAQKLISAQGSSPNDQSTVWAQEIKGLADRIEYLKTQLISVLRS